MLAIVPFFVALTALQRQDGGWIGELVGTKLKVYCALRLAGSKYVFDRQTMDFDYREAGTFKRQKNWLIFTFSSARSYDFKHEKENPREKQHFGKRWKMDWRPFEEKYALADLPDGTTVRFQFISDAEVAKFKAKREERRRKQQHP